MEWDVEGAGERGLTDPALLGAALVSPKTDPATDWSPMIMDWL